METKSTLYNEFPFFLKRYFPYKVQKISLNAGFTCPNRDGNKGVGGCTYCKAGFFPDQLLINFSGKIFRIHKPFSFLLKMLFLLCTQISGNEVSRLFPGLYQYVW